MLQVHVGFHEKAPLLGNAFPLIPVTPPAIGAGRSFDEITREKKYTLLLRNGSLEEQVHQSIKA